MEEQIIGILKGQEAKMSAFGASHPLRVAPAKVS